VLVFSEFLAALWRAITKAYDDNVPMEGYFHRGALHTILHSALVLPNLTASTSGSTQGAFLES
jgi:hypothetical protein